MGRRKFEPMEKTANNIIELRPGSASVCDNKLFYAARIKELRTAAQITQAELASRLGLTRSAILNWETGRTRPDISNIPALCQALDFPVSDFFSSDAVGMPNYTQEAQLISSYRHMSANHQRFLVKMAVELESMDQETARKAPRIHLLKLSYAEDAVAAGIGTEGFEASCTQVYVHDTARMQGTDILFHVNGDSMEPDYPNGCVVMVKRDSGIQPGDIGVFSVDGTLYIKEYQQDGLHSLNTAYPPMLSANYPDILVIGRVIGIAKKKDFATSAEIKEYEERE